MIAAAFAVAVSLSQSPPSAPPVSLPPSLAKSINTVRPVPQFDGWATPMHSDADAPPPRGIVYRWWTIECPWCRQSLPALEQLRKDYASRGIQFVAVFHPKPPRPIAPETIAADAKALGFNGPVAIDTDWSELKRLVGAPSGLSATSVTVVFDSSRRMVHAHKGPVLFPSSDRSKAQENDGFVKLQQAVERIAMRKPSSVPVLPKG